MIPQNLCTHIRTVWH